MSITSLTCFLGSITTVGLKNNDVISDKKQCKNSINQDEIITKKIDLKNLKRSSRNILIGGIVGLSIFSGVNQTPVYASSTSISNDASSTNIDIPDDGKPKNNAKSNGSKSKKSSRSSRGSSSFADKGNALADLIAKGIQDAGKFAEDTVKKNLSSNKYKWWIKSHIMILNVYTCEGS